MVISLIFACLMDAHAAPTVTPDQIAEMENSFKFNGKVIHPALIQQFESWLSDPGIPVTVSVDVAAASGTNQYSDEGVSEEPNHVVQYKYGYKSYSYQWIGKLQNGMHLVRTWARGSGSGVFQTLFFLRLQQSSGYLSDGTPYPRLLLVAERAYPLGDRTSVEILVKGNEIDLKIKTFPSGKMTNAVVPAFKQ